MAPSPKGTVCPYLGWYVDAQTHHAYPSSANHCHTQEPPLTIDLAYQASTCLAGDWGSCPRYKAAVSEGVVQRPNAIPWLERTKSRGLPNWAFVAVGLVALALIAALFLLLRPEPAVSDRGTATEATGLIETTPTAVAIISTAEPSPTESAPTVPPTTGAATLVPLPTTGAAPSSLPGSSQTSVPLPSLAPSGMPSAGSASATPALSPAPAETGVISATGSPAAGTAGPTDDASFTATLTPTPTATAAASVTRGSSATATRTTARTPTRAAASPTPRPAVSGPQFPAPVLVSPFPNQVFSSRDTVTLQWQGVGALAPDEYYEIVVAYSPSQDPGQTWYDETPWTKGTSWNLSDHGYLINLSSDGVFRWSVHVMRRTGINDQGKPTGIARSPMSEARPLTWKHGGGGDGGGGTSEPPPP